MANRAWRIETLGSLFAIRHSPSQERLGPHLTDCGMEAAMEPMRKAAESRRDRTRVAARTSPKS